MGAVIYRIVEHDGGWAYKLGDVFSETFSSREEAHDAAEQAAAEQRAPGDDEEIEYEDEKGRWLGEHSAGNDRPDASVED